MEFEKAGDELFTAWAKAKEQLVQPEKNQTNPFFKNKYADLGACSKVASDACKGTGISWFQNVVNTDKGVGVQTIIVHTSGQYIVFGPLSVPADKQNAQGLGSAETYARRYSLCAVFGIVADPDEDGNEASNYRQTSNRQQSSRRPAQNIRPVSRTNSHPAPQTSNRPAPQTSSRPAPQANSHSTQPAAKKPALHPKSASEAAIAGLKKQLIDEVKRVAGVLKSDNKTVISQLFSTLDLKYSQKSYEELSVSQLNNLIEVAKKMEASKVPNELEGGKA